MINQTFNSYYLEMVAIIYEFNGKQYVSATTYIKLEEENRKLKLHIEAKDKAYTALLKDYEEIKEDRDRMKAEIEQRLNAFRNR